MLSVPPPNSGAVGLVEIKGGAAGLVEIEIVVVEMMFCVAIWFLSTVLGSDSIACVMVPAAMNDVRSWGIRAVGLFGGLFVTVWLGNGILLPVPILNGVMSTAGIVGGGECALRVDCCAVGDRGHACQRHPLLRISRCRDDHPEPRLEMNPYRLIRLGYVADRL